jgi:hypothetical protein
MWCLQQISTTSLRAVPQINNDKFLSGIRSGITSLQYLLLWASSILDFHGNGEVEFKSLSEISLGSTSLAVKTIYEMTAK